MVTLHQVAPLRRGGKDSPCEGARRVHGKHKSEEREEIVSGATRRRAIIPRSGLPLAAIRTLPIHAKLRASVGAHKTQQVMSQEGLGGGAFGRMAVVIA
jgi:hypothetical protein